MNQDLLEILKNATEWLKFAEAKNAALIAFNGATIFGIASLSNSCNSFFKYYLLMSACFLLFSTIVAFLSMTPRLNIIKEGLAVSKGTPSVIYFEYLKDMSDEEIYEDVTLEKFEKASKVDKDLTEQIRQISKLASRKYSYFLVAIWMTISALITPVLGGLFYLNSREKNS